MMYPRSILVSHICQIEGTTASHGCSGVIIADNWVLTHGTVLHPKMRGTPASNFLTRTKPDELTIIPREFQNDLLFRILWEDSGIHTERNGFVAISWICSSLKETFNNQLQNWIFGKRVGIGTDYPVPIFLLIRIHSKPGEFLNDNTVFEAKKVLKPFYEHNLHWPTIGYNAEVVSTPFGFPLFLNSISRGIISNIIGPDRCLFISDAYTIPGCEGGPIYVLHENGRKYICGLIISILYGEPQGYTFAASIRPSLQRILSEKNEIPLTIKSIQEENVDDKNATFFNLITKSVVAVKCGLSWGTGIIIDKKSGTILTCSHVVAEAAQNCIKVLWKDSKNSSSSNSSSSSNAVQQHCDARLMFAVPNAMPYDVAILRIDPKKMDLSLRDAVIGSTRRNISQGEPVATVGYPFFSNSPTISIGNIAKFSTCILQTTCCVQNGISGGPIVRWPTGEMLGIVVCNVICPISRIPHSRLNMAIPASVLKNPLQEYIRTNDLKVLKALICTDKSVRHTWDLCFPPRAKM